MERKFYCIKTLLIAIAAFSLTFPILSGALAQEHNPLSNKEVASKILLESSVELTSVQGIVQIQRANASEWSNAAVGEKLHPLDKIRTLIGSLAELKYADGTTLTLRENSLLTIKDTSRDTKTGLTKRELKLNVGGMKYKVTPLSEKGSEFKIYSSTAIVGVTGTEGAITNAGEGQPTKNILTEGSTYNTDENGSSGQPLKAGNAWEIGDNASADRHMLTTEEKDSREYKEKDAATQKRFDGFINKYHQMMSGGYDVTPLQEMLNRLYQAAGTNDPVAINALLDGAEKILEELKKPADQDAQEANEILQGLNKEMENKEKDGYDLTAVYLLLAKANESFQEARYEEVRDTVEEAKLLLSTCEKKTYDFDLRFQQLLDEISLKAKAGFIVDEAVELTRRIKSLFDGGERAQAEALLNQAKEMLSLAKRGVPEELLKVLEELKSQVSAKKKDGFEVAQLEELLLQAAKARDENAYLSLEGLIKELKEKIARGLNKKIPDELLVLFNRFEAELKKGTESGYDLGGMQGLIHSVYAAREKDNLGELPKLLAQALDELGKIKAPGQLIEHLQDIKTRAKEKQEAGYQTSEIDSLVAQIQSSLDKGAISNAQDLLAKAEGLLNALLDDQPPLLQAGDLVYQDNNVTVSGVATDNIKVAWVSVNANQVKLEANGKFTQELTLVPGMKEILVEAADSQGNLAPSITIPVPDDKIPAPQQEDKTPPELKSEDVTLTYIMPDGLKVEGKAEPAAIISINKTEVYTDASGLFSSQLTADKELLDSGLTISARDANGNTSQALNIKVEDKWPAQIEINTVELLDNLPPVLKTGDLLYEKDALNVSGNCIDAANIVVGGTVTDIGQGIKNIYVNGDAASLEGDGFKAALTLTKDLRSVEVTVEDASGNKSSLSRTVDFFLKTAQVAVNERQVTLDNTGNYSVQIPLEANLHQVVVKAKDDAGNEASPVKLVVADRLAPTLELGDVLYTIDSVEINGKTEARAAVYDRSARLFSDKIAADDNGIFKISLKRPQENVTATLIAEDISGNLSAEVSLTINALSDQKPPLLTVSNLQYQDNRIIVSGSVEDDTGIKSVAINGKEATLNNSRFSEELPASADLLKIEILATDLSGKTTSVIKAVNDTLMPSIKLNELKYEGGYCVVEGNVLDNLGLKEVRVNNIPIPIKLPEGGDFEYKLAITPDLNAVVIGAIDLYGNYAQTEPAAVTLPADNIAPVLTLDEISYGSPIAIVSGKVTDNLGVKDVLINNLPVNIYEDGSFKTQVPIKFGTPSVSLNEPVYDNGLAKVSGSVNPGSQDPYEISAQAEDLRGNKSELLKKPVSPFNIGDLKVTVNAEPVDLENDTFSAAIPLEKGMSDIQAEVVDPFGNASGAITLALEKIPPIITLDNPAYKENTVTISGTATDSGSGVLEVLINDKAANLGSDGKFSQDLTLNENNVIVVAVDKLGNMSTAPPLQLSPPDRSAPVFIIKVTPMPATVGKNVFIRIEALDSKTRIPELLPNPPEVKVTLPNAETRNLILSGAGASFNGTLETGNLPTGLISLSVKGTDQAGNTGDRTEGTNSFLLNSTDNVSPALKININPASPVAPGTNLKITATSSETLKSLPKAEINLPGGMNFPLKLEGPLSGTVFTAAIMIPSNLTPGNALIRISEVIDPAGNTQAAPLEMAFTIMPQAIKSNLPLYIESSQISSDKLFIKGNTASEAIVHLSIADIKADVPADSNGRFNFTREISRTDIEKWTKNSGPFLRLDSYATNYAGSSSERVLLNIPLPSLLPAADANANFIIEIQPEPVEQGRHASILVKSRTALNQPPRAIIKLSDNRTETLALSGTGKEYSASYQTSALIRPGPAMIEVRSEALFQARQFLIVPTLASTGAGFFVLNINPDPIIVGKEAEISITTQRPLANAPRLSIRLPGGKSENITLTGEGKEFKGKYLCPANIQPGPAELIINDGEFRRPCGVAPAFSFGATSAKDIFAFSNPMPMLSGASATITVKSMQNLDFLPKADLRLGNGRFLPLNLSGNVPGNIFSGQINIPADAPFGPAAILVKSTKGEFVGEYPTNIAPSASATTNAEAEAFMMPYSAVPGQNIMINITAKRTAFTALPQAKLIFSNNMILPLRLEGALPAQNLRAAVVIPLTAPFGPVTIAVSDNSGKPIGAGQGMIGANTQMSGGDIQINIMPPNPMPGASFELSLFAPNSLYQLPKATLFTEKGGNEIRLNGAVPGNTFRALFTFPKDTKVAGSKIEVRFDRGQGEEIRNIYLEGRDEAGPEFRPPQLIPYPPIPGQPLMLKLYAPEVVDFIPLVRVNYTNGQNVPLNMSGPIPGDTFSGTLPNVMTYVKSLDVIDPDDNSVIVSLSVEMFGGYTGTPLTPRVEFNPPAPLMPAVMTNLTLDFPGPVPVLPRVNLQLPDGRNVNIFVNGMIPGTRFTGFFNLPSDTPYGQANLQVYVADQPVPGIPSPMVGTGMYTANMDILDFRVFPGGCQELILDWYILPNAVKHRITYEASGIPLRTLEVSRIGHYQLTGLAVNTEYRVTLVALDLRGTEISRAERMVRVPECGTSTGNGFPLRASPSGNKGAQLNWDPQYGATSYELHYALDADPMGGTALPLGNVTSYFLSNLGDGKYHFIVEAITSSGMRARSQEAIVFIGMAGPGTPPALIPNPPVFGQPLEIQFTTPEMISVVPKVGVHYQTMAEETAAVTGSVPGSAFVARIPSVKDIITMINFYDPYTNELKHSYPLSQYASTNNLRANIMFTPDPPVMATYAAVRIDIVDANTNQPVNITGYPQVYAKFLSNQIPLYPTGALPGSTFNADITAANFTSALDYIYVIHNGAEIGRKVFTQASGGTNILTVTPDPPIIGQNLYVSVQTAAPQPYQPYVNFIFTDGTYWNVLMSGNAGGTNFNFTYNNLIKSLYAIEIWDNGRANKLTEKIFGSSVTQDPTQYITLSFSPYPPVSGQPINFVVDMPTNYPYMQVRPQLTVNYVSGTSPLTESLTLNSGVLPGWHFEGSLTQLKNMFESVKVTIGTYERTFYYTFSQTDNSCWQINLSPDPPQPALAVAVTLTNTCGFSLTQAQIPPRLKVTYQAATPIERDMFGSGTSYNYSLTAAEMSDYIKKIEIFDKTGAFIKAKDFTPPTCPWTLNVSPNPPQLAVSCAVTLNNTCGKTLTQAPYIKVYFADNTTRNYTLGGSGSSYTYNISASEMITYINKIETYDNNGIIFSEPEAKIVFSNAAMGYPTNPWDEATGIFTERRIHWDTVPGATGYDIYAGLNNPPSTKWREVFGGNINTEIISGLTTGQTYYYYVTVRGATAYDRIKNFTAGAGGTSGGSGKLKINSPSPDQSGITLCDFNDTNPGATTNVINISIQNIGNTAVNLRKRVMPLVNISNSGLTIPIGHINFPDSLSIPPTTTVTQGISISVPSGTTSGDYGMPPGEEMELYDDENNNGGKDTNESSVKIRLSLLVGTFVEGISILQGGIDFGSAVSGTNTSTMTINVQSTSTVIMSNIRTTITPLGLSGGGAYISSSNVYFSLNSSVANALGVGETTYSTVYVSVPSGQTSGTYSGILTIYNDTDYDTTLDSGVEPYEFVPLMLNVTSAGGINHITLSTVPSSNTTSSTGKPVLVQATAYTSSDNSAVATSFSNSVTVSASSSSNKYILSLQDRVTGSTGQLQLSNGVGYFTVDTVQTETVTVNISGYTSNSLGINFITPSAPDLSASQIALTYESESAINTPGKITVFIVNNYGKTAVNYTGTININLTDPAAPSVNLTTVPGEANGSFSGAGSNYTYTFAAADNGKASFNLNDTQGESVGFNIITGSLSAGGSVAFAGVAKFIIEPVNPVIRGGSIQLSAFAATANGKKLTGYNTPPDPAVSWVRVSEVGGSTNNSSSATALSFVNGVATFTLSDSEYEQVIFHVTNGSLVSSDITAQFSSSSDTTPPDITNTVAETPFLIHLYFSEDIDSVNALRKDIYTGIGLINKVCWYGDEVTLHLAAPLPLSSSQSVNVLGVAPNGIRDLNGNYMGDKNRGFTVPAVDYQGSSYGSGDWLEIQVSPNTVPSGSAQTVKVMIYHKNACGYLSGSNSVNRSTDVPNISLNYNNPSYISSPPSSASMSDGKCQFDLTLNFTAPGQSVSITATSNNVTSGTATITSQ